MPRSPSGIYSAPAGTTAVSGQTIASASYNSLKDDLVQDANTARPVVAGGTGANNDLTARENLGVYGRTFRIDTTGMTATEDEDNQLIDFTGSGTLATDPAADLGDGWQCYVYASGGSVTIDPNLTETVNGQTSIVMSEGGFGILRVYDGNFLFTQIGGDGLPKITVYASAGSFTHTFDTSSTKFQVEGCGAGGAGAGTTSGSISAGDNHYGHGGHSGWHFETDVLDRGAITSATLVIGAGGTSTAASNTKVNGGNTTYNDGTNSFTWDGGLSPLAINANGVTGPQMYQYAQPSTPANAKARYGQGRFGSRGIFWTGTDSLGSGYGGDSPYGKGGLPVAANSAGNAGTGNGSGGSGSAKSGGTSAYNGGAGRPGIIIIKEWS